jgi:hypothetical protein
MADIGPIDFIISHENRELPLKLSFPLKNGHSKVSINDRNGSISYYDHNDNLIQELKFSYSNLEYVDNSFSKVLEKIILLDRSSKQPKSHDVVLSPTHGGN